MLSMEYQTDPFSFFVLRDVARRVAGSVNSQCFQAPACSNMPLKAWSMPAQRIEFIVEGAVDMLFSAGNGERAFERMHKGSALWVMPHGWNLPCADAAKTLSVCWRGDKFGLSYNHWQDGRCISLAKWAMPRDAISSPFEQEKASEACLLDEMNMLLGTVSTRLLSYTFFVSKQKQLFHQILIYIRCHFHGSLSRDSVAEHFCISASYLSHVFQRYSNVGFNEYINSERVAHARHLLVQKKMRVKQVAFESGFVDADYFCRLFKRASGVTPTQYRQQHL